MLSKTWKIVLLAIIIGFSLWETIYSAWVILLAAVLLLVFEVGSRCDCRGHSVKAMPKVAPAKASKTSKKKKR